ncbi:uncharacterized protein MELLADRAFT_87848 [Melampsora larici-populina 98AG31]|uniref:Pre-mRNA-splicing factor Syf1/CRNKL1-like C-terminal HAT-repeats domain-containing protein n=1 Tax=Melampsora larici-populina (strain 98AG31 / pathotype 3-4-7) TaxID=747676 RepID=F4RPP5_MELLP|nr:uncharacterized protein MELLADRAFT_87848 [Melampsora larici-populina 98AG31]EGG05577.1 hypothetical protein MELLADRAFT_87848 [Melampsora larici-populina 98AG31]
MNIGKNNLKYMKEELNYLHFQLYLNFGIHIHYKQGNKIEGARDLFEQALENCPEKFIKPIFLLWAELHENAKRAMSVLERATTN